MTLLLLLACTSASDAGKSPDAGHDTSLDTDTQPFDTDDSADDDSGDTDTADTDTEDTDTGPVYPIPCDAWGAPRDLGVLDDIERNEVSGVAPSIANPGVLWMLEDHGNAPAFYAIDVTGVALGTVTIEGVENVDWEAIAIGPCGEATCLWAADVGDNTAEREDVALYRIAEPDVGWGGGLDLTVVAEKFPLDYAERAVNVEAFALTPEGLPALFTKRNDGTSDVYVVDALVPDVFAAPRFVGTLNTRQDGAEDGGIVTSADLWPDGSRLLLRTYDTTWEFDLGALGVEGVATATRTVLPFAPERQVEAVAYDTVLGGYWQIPEAEAAPVSFTACID